MLKSPYPKLSQTTEQFSNFIVNRDSIHVTKVLSSGNFGTVQMATYRGTEVAVKWSKMKNNRKKIVAEAKTMCHLNHPRLIRLLGICCEPIDEPVWLILEYMANGTLNAYLQKNKPTYEKLLNILFQVSINMNSRVSYKVNIASKLLLLFRSLMEWRIWRELEQFTMI